MHDFQIRLLVPAADVVGLANNPLLQHSRNHLTVIHNVQLESNLQHAAVGTRVQLERIGYFCVDPDTQQDQLVLNQIVALRDSLPRDKPS